jgi:hypothetical protein
MPYNFATKKKTDSESDYIKGTRWQGDYRLFSAAKQNPGCYKFKGDREGGTVLVTMAGNTGHGLLSWRNIQRCDKYLTCGGDYVEM